MSDVLERLATAEDGYIIEAQGLRWVEEPTTQAAWERVGDALLRRRSASQWALGDWIRLGHRWGDQYAAAMAVTGFTYQHVAKLLAVAERFPPADRHPQLSWTHHLYAKSAPPDTRVELLARAAAERWSTMQMREEALRLKEAADAELPPILPALPAPRPPRGSSARRRWHVACPSCQTVFPVRDHTVRAPS